MQEFLDSELSGVQIAVDSREDVFFDDFFKAKSAAVNRQMLNVGDFIVSARLVVERKTRADFEQSIVDGRLFKQLASMKENYSSIVVIVEGTSDAERINKNALLGAYSSIIADYGCTLFFTKDKEKTAELIYSLAHHEQIAKKHPMRIYARKKTYTLAESQRAILESFPMVGPKLAKAILIHFGSVDNFAKSTERELKEVPGMGPKRAKLIHSVLSSQYDSGNDSFE